MAAEEAVRAIYGAADRGDTEGVARMLDEDPRLLTTTWSGDTLLMKAGSQGHVGVVRLLLEQGAEVDAHSNLGDTALQHAALRGHEEVVSLLLNSGANPSRREGGRRTALMRASESGHAAVVRLLLRSMGGRGLDDRDHVDFSALFYACLYGHADVVRALLLAGADHTIARQNGQTPLQIAQARHRHQCVAVIQWWDGELQRASALDKARTLYDDAATRQQAPAAPVPAYLSQRVQGGKGLPQVQLSTKGGSGGPRTRGAAKRGVEEGGQEEEEEVCATLGFVVKDLDGHLYTELMRGLGLR